MRDGQKEDKKEQMMKKSEGRVKEEKEREEGRKDESND